ncbi:glycoside hydrolase family 3 protein [Phytohabitans rumicis]|uniref:Hydrolase n=1 Tax=Phytohabitans rumicis TaxID=1076125 RepID=A0A6V8L056_9ACTN|nr:glycoside hydrolase family 3 protein [Phytohabitans rumicis]GFJ88131.1 hydrolase [Phytohabitans rumicis]
MSEAGRDLVRLAGAVLQPGFEGTSPPPWVRRWLGEGLGGVALFGRNVENPAQVAALTAALRAERPDVIVAIDEEAGDVTRFETRQGSSRPGNLALGAVDDVALTEAVARDLGHDLAQAGITLDYAPDADVNVNPDNPVIGVRAFGADPDLVARHTAAWITGLQSAGVAACAKHFPGHGDTSVDSHIDVPRIGSSRAELDVRELPPFRAAIAAGVQAIMTGHLLVPAVDPYRPATLSRAVVTDLLRDELGFPGAVITDGIEMRALTRRYGLEGAAVQSLAAGVDAICVGGDHADEGTASRLRAAIVEAVTSGALPEERLAEAAKRVEQLAAWTAQARAAAMPDRPGGAPVGLAAARRAVRVIGTGLPLAAPPHVVEFEPPLNMAIGPETPWGVAVPLLALLPGTTATRLSAEADGFILAADGRPLVLVVRDLHRYDWMARAVASALAARPDAVVVEMGVAEKVVGAVHVATFGATRACGQAAAEVLAGRTA